MCALFCSSLGSSAGFVWTRGSRQCVHSEGHQFMGRKVCSTKGGGQRAGQVCSARGQLRDVTFFSCKKYVKAGEVSANNVSVRLGPRTLRGSQEPYQL